MKGERELQRKRKVDAGRVASSRRGYDAEWRRLRADFLDSNPICSELGCGEAATDVDHILSISLRPDLRLDLSNLRALCHSHHSRRTSRDQSWQKVPKTMVEKKGAVAWAADTVERWSVSRLVPHAANARTHSDAQIEQIAAAIKEWGWTNPVLVDEAGVIIAGHGRVLAARLLGLSDVPVMIAVGWSDAQKRAYIIADNKLAENAGWDDNRLRSEARSLSDAGFDLGLVGFSADELAAMSQTSADLPIREIPTGPVSDRFWISLRGPLAKQADVLDVVRAAIGTDQDLQIDVGVISMES